ncbi:Uncharacterised protein [Chlamydia trachomatis]|nr:Uncharacterised protein [Chlamydia trachomatis]
MYRYLLMKLYSKFVILESLSSLLPKLLILESLGYSFPKLLATSRILLQSLATSSVLAVCLSFADPLFANEAPCVQHR